MDELTRHRPARAELVLLPGDQATITGTPAEVGAALVELRRRGQLVGATAPVPTGIAGQVLVNARLLPAVQRTTPAPRRHVPGWVWATAAAGAVGVLGGLGWLLYVLVAAAADHIALIVGAIVLGAVLLGAGGRACTTIITIKHHH